MFMCMVNTHVGFKKRHNVKLIRPDPLTDVRSRQSKKEIIEDFFDKLKHVYDQHSLSPQCIYNLDETGKYIHALHMHVHDIAIM